MRMVSFDVWNTLLNLDVMLDEFAVSLAKAGRICLVDAADAIMMARNEVKKRRKTLKGEPSKALEESIRLLAELIDVRADVIKRATAMAVLGVDESIVIPGAEVALAGVRRLGIKAVVTGNVMFWPGSYTRLLLERFGLLRHIDATFFSDEVGAYKPMREMFEASLREFNVKPEEAIHVGDTYEEDFKGALNAGMWTAWINPEAKGIRKIEERGFEIREVRDILEVLRMLG